MVQGSPPPVKARPPSPPAAGDPPHPAGAPTGGDTADVDVLFHLGLRVARSAGGGRPPPPGTDDAVALFGRVTHAVLCGSASRACALAEAFADATAGEAPLDLTRTDRYALWRTAGGRVVVASHGIGRPSVSVVLHELTKLFRYARAGNGQASRDTVNGRGGVGGGTGDLPPVTYYRVGTCGGIGVPAGTLVLTARVVDGQLRGEAVSTVLGVRRAEPAVLDERVVATLATYARTVDWGRGGSGGADEVPTAADAGGRVVVGTTVTLDGFYEEQGRMDGASCEFDDARRAAWLRAAYDAGVRNFEMEGLEFAAFTHRHGIPAAMACVALLNRLEGDQVSSPPAVLAAWEADLIRLVVGFVRHRLEEEAAGVTEAAAS